MEDHRSCSQTIQEEAKKPSGKGSLIRIRIYFCDVCTVKIQLWNLGFVEAHQNSILRGQGFLSTRGGWKEHAAFPHRQLTRKQSRRQKSAVHEQRQEKAEKRSSTVVAVFKCDRFFVWAHRDRDVYPTCPTLGGTSRETPTTSTTTTVTGRTIMETIQRERPATSPTTARDKTPTTAAPQPGAAWRKATLEAPVVRNPEREPAVPTSEAPRQPPQSRCPRGLPCWGTS